MHGGERDAVHQRAGCRDVRVLRELPAQHLTILNKVSFIPAAIRKKFSKLSSVIEPIFRAARLAAGSAART